MDSKTQIGANIRRLRKEQGWSQVELASKVGVSGAAISSFERGDMKSGVRALRKLNVVLGENIDRPVKGPGDMLQPYPAGGRHHPDLWANVIAARNNRDLSQHALAILLSRGKGDVTEAQVAALEEGVLPNEDLYQRLVEVFGDAVLTITRPKAGLPYQVVVARSEQEHNERVLALLQRGYRLRGPLHVVTDAQGLLLVQDLATPQLAQL